MEKMVNSNATYKDKFAKVCKIYRIAITSAATTIAETGGFELFENYSQVASYAGYKL